VVIRKTDGPLAWQSKAILLLVVPWTVASVILQAHWWFTQVPEVAWMTLGISAIFGLVAWKVRAGTPAAAATGAAICASLMFATTQYPYQWSWLHGGLLPLLAVFLLTFAATKVGKAQKESLGTGESKRGRNAPQIVANLGIAAVGPSVLLSLPVVPYLRSSFGAIAAFVAITALAEAAADTVSSEIGQVFGGEPRLITSLRKVEKGTDGAVTFAGSVAGAGAALLVALAGFWAMRGNGFAGYWPSILLATAGGVFGLFFDSLLGATLERRGWLNNDAVNFLSTLSAPLFSGALMWFLALFLR
jgi:uncharacterized protein (TIGR00297 family)